MKTLFDLPDIKPIEETIIRYVVKVVDLDDGDVSYYRQKSVRSQYDTPTDFINVSEPIKTRGQKLPKMYKSYTQANNRVVDLYSRHKKGGEGIRIGVEKWSRLESANEWAIG